MSEIFGQHRQDLNEVRRLCLICHGLDLTSDKLFSDSAYNEKSPTTREVFQNLVSSSLLHLAVSIRVNLYQGRYSDFKDMNLMHCVFYYDHQDYMSKELTIKDVCDKIIHADEVYKEAFPKEILDDSKLAMQFKGKHHGKGWTLDLSLDLFAEEVLNYLDKIELAEEK